MNMKTIGNLFCSKTKLNLKVNKNSPGRQQCAHTHIKAYYRELKLRVCFPLLLSEPNKPAFVHVVCIFEGYRKKIATAMCVSFIRKKNFIFLLRTYATNEKFKMWSSVAKECSDHGVK